jgi:hypothetical protein
MKIYCLYYKENFVVAFPNREDCITYGKKHYEGMEWDCNIIEKFLNNSPQYPLTTLTPKQTTPHKVGDVPYTPYTPPIPLKTTPYEPNIWCEKNGNVRATYEWNETGEGV